MEIRNNFHQLFCLSLASHQTLIFGWDNKVDLGVPHSINEIPAMRSSKTITVAQAQRREIRTRIVRVEQVAMEEVMDMRLED